MALDPLTTTIAVTLAALVLFVTEWIRPAYTAVLIAAALVTTGVLSVEEGLGGLSSAPAVTIASMFVLAAGIEKTGVLSRVARWLLRRTEGQPKRAFLVLFVLAGLFSSVLNNTPVVALMIPLVITIARRIDTSPSRYLMPLSFLAMLGGTMTLIGTSTNLVGSGVAERLGYGAFGWGPFLRIGGVAFLVGGAFLVTVGPRLAPPRRSSGPPEERFGLTDYLAEVVVDEGSPLVGQPIGKTDLRFAYDVEVLRVHRDGRWRPQNLVDVEVRAGDALLISATPDELVRLLQERGLSTLSGETHRVGLETGRRQLFEATVTRGPSVAGRTLEASRFRERFGAQVVAVKHGREVIRDRLPETRVEPGDTLLLLGDRFAQEALARSGELVLADPLEVDAYRAAKLPLAIGILAIVIAVGATGVIDLPIAGVLGVVAMALTGCLHPPEIVDAVDWKVIVVLAGVLPLGTALETSGGATELASLLVDQAAGLPAWAMLAIVYAITVLLAQAVTNIASVAVMLPVAADVATQLSLSPPAFLLAVTSAGSAGFLTPIGHQTSLMVYGAGEYRFTDYARLGLPLVVIVGVVTVTMLATTMPLTG